ncbi:MAG: NADH-quinone oxidoreductase subunit N [Desulfobacterales bacterium]|nr:NADH-quinone oxidoreductase subunit N [Desulfobacterales bacterium]
MNWMAFTPELTYVAMAAVFLGLSMAREDHRRDFHTALVFSAVGVGVSLASAGVTADLFAESYRVDLFSQVFKVLLACGFFLVVVLCNELSGVKRRLHPEFYLLLTTSTLALMLLVSSVHLLTIYVSLELSSYSLYVLVYLRKNRPRRESTVVHYFLIGASASAVMVFGIALLYGSTRTMYAVEMARVLPSVISQPAAAIGFVMTLAGFFFKLAVFPFHFWAPEVYEGAVNQLTTYIATASKAAAIALLVRLTALGDSSAALAQVLVVLSIVTMTVGNVSAIVQKDLKRLLAYSSVAHAGYVLIGILSMNPAGYAGAVFYSAALVTLKFTCFMVLVKVAADGANITVDELAGLHKRSPILALALMLSLFGLCGIPPTIGFIGKLLVFTAAVEKGYFTLVLIAMINVVISLYYYLLVLKAAYLTEPKAGLPPLPVSAGDRLLAGTLIVLIVGIGFYPDPVIQIARSAAAVLL